MWIAVIFRILTTFSMNPVLTKKETTGENIKNKIHLWDIHGIGYCIECSSVRSVTEAGGLEDEEDPGIITNTTWQNDALSWLLRDNNQVPLVLIPQQRQNDKHDSWWHHYTLTEWILFFYLNIIVSMYLDCKLLP